MKKLDKTIQIEFKMPSLYREDIEEIQSVIKAIPNQSGFRIRTEGYEYDEVSEIAYEGRSVHEMVISSNEPYMNLSLNNDSAEIFVSGKDAIQVTGVSNFIADIVKKRERKIRWMNSRITLLLCLPILSIALVTIFGKPHWLDRLTRQQLIILIVFILAPIVVGIRDSFFCYSSVNFSLRSKKVNWFVQNKDQILVELIKTIVSLTIGYIIGTLR